MCSDMNTCTVQIIIIFVVISKFLRYLYFVGTVQTEFDY